MLSSFDFLRNSCAPRDDESVKVAGQYSMVSICFNMFQLFFCLQLLEMTYRRSFDWLGSEPTSSEWLQEPSRDALPGREGKGFRWGCMTQRFGVPGAFKTI